MKEFEKRYSEENNLLFVKARLSWIILPTLVYHIFLAILVNLVFYLLFAEYYINSLTRHYLLNFLITGIIFVICAVFHAYGIYKEAYIQYINKKIYYDKFEKRYSTIFNVSLSLFFALMLLVLFDLSFANYMNAVKDMFESHETLIVLSIFIFIFLFLYFFVKIRLFLIGVLLFIENNFSPAKNKIDFEIKEAKRSKTALTLAVITITNISDIAKELDISKKKTVNYILLKLRNKTRLDDLLVARNFNNGVIWHLGKMDEKTMNYVIENRLKPAFNEGIELNEKFVIPNPSWKIVNISGDKRINSIKDLIYLGNLGK